MNDHPGCAILSAMFLVFTGYALWDYAFTPHEATGATKQEFVEPRVYVSIGGKWLEMTPTNSWIFDGKRWVRWHYPKGVKIAPEMK